MGRKGTMTIGSHSSKSMITLESTMNSSNDSSKRQSRRRMRPVSTSSKRAVAMALALVSGLGVAAFSSSRPLASTGDSLLASRSPCKAVSTSSLSTERLDTRQLGLGPSSPLGLLGKDQHEFELSVGHAMDILRDDYQVILTSNPGTGTIQQ